MCYGPNLMLCSDLHIASQNIIFSSGPSFDKAVCVTAHAAEERVVYVSISLCQFMFPNKDVGLRQHVTRHTWHSRHK